MIDTITCTTVLLDAGGILYIPDHDIALNAARAFGVALDPEDIDAAHYAACVAFEAIAVVGDPHEPFWGPYLERYAAALFPDCESPLGFAELLRVEFRRIPIWQRIAPDAIAGLAALQATGARLGIVSNHNGTLAAMLHRDGIASIRHNDPEVAVCVETIIDSHVVGLRKPGAEVFHCALRNMNVSADDCIYVGDMPAIDVVGAHNAGIRPLVMDPHGAHGLQPRYATIRSLRELAANLIVQ